MPGLYAQKSGIYKRLSYPYQYGVIKSTSEFLPTDFHYDVNDIFLIEGQTRTDIAGKIFHYGQILKKSNNYAIESDGFIDDDNLTVANFQPIPLADVVTPIPVVVTPVAPSAPAKPIPVVAPKKYLHTAKERNPLVDKMLKDFGYIQ